MLLGKHLWWKIWFLRQTYEKREQDIVLMMKKNIQIDGSIDKISIKWRGAQVSSIELLGHSIKAGKWQMEWIAGINIFK